MVVTVAVAACMVVVIDVTVDVAVVMAVYVVVTVTVIVTFCMLVAMALCMVAAVTVVIMVVAVWVIVVMAVFMFVFRLRCSRCSWPAVRQLWLQALLAAVVDLLLLPWPLLMLLAVLLWGVGGGAGGPYGGLHHAAAGAAGPWPLPVSHHWRWLLTGHASQLSSVLQKAERQNRTIRAILLQYNHHKQHFNETQCRKATKMKRVGSVTHPPVSEPFRHSERVNHSVVLL